MAKPRVGKNANERQPATPLELSVLPPTVLPVVVSLGFTELGMGVSVYARGVWRPLHVDSGVVEFEIECGVQPQRHVYNMRCLGRIERERRPLLGEHMGFHDLFVPIPSSDAILVSGPFARARPTSAQVLERWHRLSGSQGRMSDPAFARYLAATLSTPTLEGSTFDTFQALISCQARLIGGGGSADALATEAVELQDKLAEARIAEAMWEAARSILDVRTTEIWATHLKRAALASFGMRRPPRHVLATLVRGRQEATDPVDDALRHDAFQRACVGLARKQGAIVCGRIGHHGAVFLLDSTDSGARARAKLQDLAARASAIARRFELKLHSGIAPASGTESVVTRYREALGAAEKALSQGLSFAMGEARPERAARHLRMLRIELGQSAVEHPSLLSTRFDRYVEAVLLRSGYHFETVAAQLEAGVERLVEPLLKTGALDDKSLEELSDSLETAAADAHTVASLVARYRQLVAEIERSALNPTSARHARSATRALTYIRDHLGDRLSLADVARVAGFAPQYFSKLMKREHGATFERYVRQLRLARAQQLLLAESTLDAERVAQLAGMGSRSHFHRVFKQALGMTPEQYRERGYAARRSGRTRVVTK